jgi:hypothetical protein
VTTDSRGLVGVGMLLVEQRGVVAEHSIVE